VRLVHLVQVEARRAQPPRARVRAPPHDGRDRDEREELRREVCLVAAVAERRAEDSLAAPEPVDLGGVEERDAELERPPYDRCGVAPGVVAAVAPLARAELPRAEADLGDARLELEVARVYSALDRAQMLMPLSVAARSIPASSSAEKSRRLRDATFSSSWATLDAPTSAEVTRGSRNAQASASC